MIEPKSFRFSRAILAALIFQVIAVVGTARAAETYKIDGVHSAALYKVKHFGASYNYGRFNDVSGTVVFDEAKPENSSVEITVKAESVDTANEKRDQHLRGPDFLDAKQFPLITFKSKKVKKTGENLFEITGELTIRGVSKSLTTTFERVGAGTDPQGAYRAGGHAVIAVRRSDFGMNYMPGAIGDEVELTISVEGIRQ